MEGSLGRQFPNKQVMKWVQILVEDCHPFRGSHFNPRVTKSGTVNLLGGFDWC